MLKKSILIFIFLITSSCGYEAMYSKTNSVDYNFSVSNINFDGDKDINLRIKQKFNNYFLSKKEKEFQLNINSITEKVIVSKNSAGEAQIYENTTTVYIDVYLESISKGTLEIKKGFKYNNNNNKFDLDTYEKDLKSNIAETIADELIFKLSSIQ